MFLFAVVSLMLANATSAAILTYFAKFIHTQVSLWLFVERNYLSHVGMFATLSLKTCLPHQWLHHGLNSFY